MAIRYQLLSVSVAHKITKTNAGVGDSYVHDYAMGSWLYDR